MKGLLTTPHAPWTPNWMQKAPAASPEKEDGRIQRGMKTKGPPQSLVNVNYDGKLEWANLQPSKQKFWYETASAVREGTSGEAMDSHNRQPPTDVLTYPTSNQSTPANW